MYSESDIEAAVASGAITAQAAAALRASVAANRAAPAVDEESFRLITGFNDIFVTIAAILLLVAVGWIGASIVPPTRSANDFGYAVGGAVGIAGALVAAVSWGLAKYFTRQRRMALPSIVLLGSFVYGVAACLMGIVITIAAPTHDQQRTFALLAALVGILTAGAAWLHWRRFHVPITIAALTGALVATLLSLLLAAVPQAEGGLLWLLLVAGLGVFGFAMWWDMSDRTRTTRRSDVAFWLHLAAAPMIAHPVFNLLGVIGGAPNVGRALLVILLYAVFGIVALAVDRRALLVSSLIYVLYAIYGLFDEAGAVSLSLALTGLVIGSGLLLLSAFWQSARRLVVERLSANVQARLPAIGRVQVVAPRPA